MSEILSVFPFARTISICILTYPFIALYASNPFNVSVQIALGAYFGVLGFLAMLGTLIYLFQLINGASHIKRETTIEEVFHLFDIWFTLLTSQAMVLYVPYMFDRVSSFSGIPISESPWYAFLNLFLLICNNFHGASGTGVIAQSSFAIIWLSISSILARMFLMVSTWFVLRLVFAHFEKQREANRKRHEQQWTK